MSTDASYAKEEETTCLRMGDENLGAEEPQIESDSFDQFLADHYGVRRLQLRRTEPSSGNLPFAFSWAGVQANGIKISDPSGDEYFASQTFSESLSNFRDAIIAVDASYYLQNFLNHPPSKEPLVAAIGGLPFSLQTFVKADLQQWKKHNITSLFVFEGQSSVGKEEIAWKSYRDAMPKIDEAWRLYSGNQADAAVKAFGTAVIPPTTALYQFFQKIILDDDITFEVATHSAATHIAQLDREDPGRIHGIMGPSELLLFNIDNCVITKIDFEKQTAFGLVKCDLLKKLNVSEDVFVDSFLMTGTSFLPPFPALVEVHKTPYSIKDAINMYRTAGKSIRTLCEHWSDTVQRVDPQWEKKYQKARMAIKHGIFASGSGPIVVDQYDNLTGDNHEYLGLRLPEEVYHHISKEILIPPPLDGGDGEEYHRLISEQLTPLREQAVSLYSSRMHRAFQHRSIAARFWYDDSLRVVVNHQAYQPQPESQAMTWTVSQSQITSQMENTPAAPGSLTFALSSLQDEAFAKSTVNKSSIASKVYGLKTMEEVRANIMWRFLHLRGYVDNEHKLTSWGKGLLTTVKQLNPGQQLEEAAFLAFELFRFGHLNTRNRHPEWIGGPEFGTENQNLYSLLICRCACLLKLRHSAIGYTGPLSKNLLSFYSIISAIRESDRDLIEAVSSSMFLTANAHRTEFMDYSKLGLSLPFMTDNNVALAIVVKTYLDEQHSKSESAEEYTKVKERFVKYPVLHSTDELKDMEMAFSFFDALYSGVKALGSEISDHDRTIWDEASKYLNERC